MLKGSPIRSWKALKQWRPSYLRQAMPMLKSAQVSANRTFSYFKEAKPLSSLPEIVRAYRSEAFKVSDVPSKRFFELVLSRNTIMPLPENVLPSFASSNTKNKTLADDSYFYSVISFDDLPTTLQYDISPLEPFIALPSTTKRKLSEEGHTVSVSNEGSAQHRLTTVWLGPSGVTTQAHYDVHDNFYAQLYGRKRFILFPPEQYRSMYLNAFLHSGAQQSQVDLDSPDYDKYPLFKNAAALDVVLEPGDVLYLPALWFHHVIAIDLSFSVSIWSRNEDTVHMWEAEKTIPPIRASWSLLKRSRAAYVYLKKLFDSSTSDLASSTMDASGPYFFMRDFNSFMQDMWAQRFEQLLKTVPSLGRESQQNPDRFCHLLNPPGKGSASNDLSPQELDSILNSAEQVASLMLRVKSPMQRSIWLANFVEHLSLAVSDLESLITFVQSLTWCQGA